MAVTTREAIEVEFVVTLDKFRQAYAEANKLPPEQAKIQMASLDKQLKAEEKAFKTKISQIKEQEKATKEAAKKETKAQEEVADKGVQRFEALKKIASTYGGTLNDIAGKTEGIGQGLSGLVGPAGLAAAAVVGLGFVGLKATSAMWSYVDAASEAVSTLEELGGKEYLLASQVARIQEYEEATRVADVASANLHLTVSSSLTPAFTDLTKAVAGSKMMLAEMAGEAGSWWDETGSKYWELAKRLALVSSHAGTVSHPLFAAANAVDLLAEKADAAAGKLGATRSQLEALTAASTTWHDVVLDLDVASGRLTKGQAWLAKESTRLTEAFEAKRKAMLDAGKAGGEEERSLIAQYQESIRLATAKAAEMDVVKGVTTARVDATDATRRLAEVSSWLQAASQSLLTEEERLTSEYHARHLAIEQLVEDGLMEEADATEALLALSKAYARQLDEINAREKQRLDTTLQQISALSSGGTYALEIKSMADVARARANDLADFEAMIDGKIRAGRALVESYAEGTPERKAAEAAWAQELLQIEEERQAGIFAIKQRWHDEEMKLHQERWGTAQENIALLGDVATAALSAIGDIAAENFAKAQEHFQAAKANVQDLEARELELRNKIKTANSEVHKAKLKEQLEENQRAQHFARMEMQERRRAMRRAWLAERAGALSQIAIQTSVAVMEAAPSVPLMAAMGILGGIQAGMVAAQPMPQFHAGVAALGMGMAPAPAAPAAPYAPGPDEVPAMLLRGESVLGRRATQEIGPENIERMNRGQPLAPPAPNYLVIDEEVIEVLADRVTRTRAFESRLPRR